MKRNQVREIARSLCASNPGLLEKGRLLAATPRGRILRGIYLEDSSNPTDMYVWAFVQPLYAPASHVALDLGKRLGGPSTTWNAGDIDAISTAVRDEGVPFFRAIVNPEALADWDYIARRMDPFALEAKAYSQIAAQRFADGIKSLNTLISTLTDQVEWVSKMRAREGMLLEQLTKNPGQAQEQLLRWETETITALRLGDIP